MRWLIVSDLHYALPQFDWLMSAAPQFDLVIFAGDALDAGSIVDYGAQIVVVRKYLERLAATTRAIFCSGNHDLDSRSDSGEKIALWVEEARRLGVACDGDAVEVDDALFSVFPWWDGPQVKEKLVGQLAADAELREGLRWIWAHHAPPRQSPTSWSGKQSFGDADLVDWIGRYRPDFVICGHIHQAPFVAEGSWVDRLGDTWVLNAGRQYGAPPAYIVIDTELQEALWLSAMGGQSVRLDQPLVRPIARLSALPDWFTPPPVPAF
jgi:Icc-related predicted phosphoesterase